MPDVPHGTPGGYTNHACRCDLCKAANSAYQRKQRETPCVSCGAPTWGRYRVDPLCQPCWWAKLTVPLEERHGTELGYKKGCRCPECTSVTNAARARRRREGKVHTHNNNGYANGCRCPVCREAHRAYRVERRTLKLEV